MQNIDVNDFILSENKKITQLSDISISSMPLSESFHPYSSREEFEDFKLS